MERYDVGGLCQWPVNIGLTFVFGASLGWIVVKLLKPQPYIANLILAVCSAGNLGNILLIIIPAICKQKGSPFGDANDLPDSVPIFQDVRWPDFVKT